MAHNSSFVESKTASATKTSPFDQSKSTTPPFSFGKNLNLQPNPFHATVESSKNSSVGGFAFGSMLNPYATTTPNAPKSNVATLPFTFSAASQQFPTATSTAAPSIASAGFLATVKPAGVTLGFDNSPGRAVAGQDKNKSTSTSRRSSVEGRTPRR